MADARVILGLIGRGLVQALEQSTQDLECANAELAPASGVKSEFLASMSHEIRWEAGVVMFSVRLQKPTPRR